MGTGLRLLMRPPKLRFQACWVVPRTVLYAGGLLSSQPPPSRAHGQAVADGEGGTWRLGLRSRDGASALDSGVEGPCPECSRTRSAPLKGAGGRELLRQHWFGSFQPGWLGH